MINSLTFHEPKQHGTPDFPVEYFYIDHTHPRYKMPFHWHKEWEIIHVLEGTFTAHADDMVYSAQAGDTVLIRDGMLHGGTPEDCVYECFLFDLHGLFRNLDMVKKYLRPVYRKQILPEIFYPAAEYPQVCESIRSLNQSCYEEARNQQMTLENPLELIVISCISRLFTLILQNNYYQNSPDPAAERPHKIDLIKSVLEYTEMHYASPITLNDLAKVAGMNPKYFCRFFRSITHQTPMEYVNMYRKGSTDASQHQTAYYGYLYGMRL